MKQRGGKSLGRGREGSSYHLQEQTTTSIGEGGKGKKGFLKSG